MSEQEADTQQINYGDSILYIITDSPLGAPRPLGGEASALSLFQVFNPGSSAKWPACARVHLQALHFRVLHATLQQRRPIR
ncbi:hypothetical protein, partial [Kordiimonas sp.]|uniref:hypothetical protein n=1 Tax=Kordiimonas sp. TaxID=1970157 RepID=UPI003A9301C1